MEKSVYPGDWYAPVGAKFRQRLRSSFDRGATRISPREGHWTRLRGLDEVILDLDRVSAAAQDLPSRGSRVLRSGITRRQYRIANQEGPRGGRERA